MTSTGDLSLPDLTALAEALRTITNLRRRQHDDVQRPPSTRARGSGPRASRARHRHRRLLRAAKVRRIRLHDGRHTAATLLLAEGIHPRVVMELLGHSTMRTTTDTYSHVLPALAQQAADTLDAALWGTGEGAPKSKKQGKKKKAKKTATKTATKNDESP